MLNKYPSSFSSMGTYSGNAAIGLQGSTCRTQSQKLALMSTLWMGPVHRVQIRFCFPASELSFRFSIKSAFADRRLICQFPSPR